MSAPAFKEWRVIVGALGAGDQIIILRKGGIAEGRGGFKVGSSRFWLFPTSFHEQLAKTKPAAERFFAANASAESQGGNRCELRYFADVERTAYLDDWNRVAALDRFHLWSEQTVRERFAWSRQPGVHVLIVRVHAVTQPVMVNLTAEMGGCKSWIDVPTSFGDVPSTPVLTDEIFAARIAQLGL